MRAMPVFPDDLDARALGQRDAHLCGGQGGGRQRALRTRGAFVVFTADKTYAFVAQRTFFSRVKTRSL